jgi:hypothetical protein
LRERVEALELRQALELRLAACRLRLRPEKTKIVYWCGGGECICAAILSWRKSPDVPGHTLAAWDWLRSLKRRTPNLFAHWALGPAAG